MQRLMLFFANMFWKTCMVLLVLTALYVVVGHQFWPAVSVYRESLQDFLAEKTGSVITIGALRGSWAGFDPQIALEDVAFIPASNSARTQSGEGAIRLKKIFLHLSVLDTLIKGRIQLKTAEVNGLTIHLVQNDAGKWALEGLGENLDNKDQAPDVDVTTYLAWIDQPSLQISDVDLIVNSRRETQVHWRIPQAHVLFEQGFLHASGEAFVPGIEQPFLRFSMKGVDRLSSQGFSGKLWVQWLSGEFLDDFLDAYSWNGLRLTSIDVSGQAWLDFYAGALVMAQGDLELKSIHWRHEQGTVAPLENARGQFFWVGSSDQSELQLSGMSMQWGALRWSESQLALRQDDKGIAVRGDRLDVSFAAQLLEALHVLPASAEASLVDYAPRGMLDAWELFVPTSSPSNPASEVFRLKANFHALSCNAVGGAPSGKNLAGYMELNERWGSVLVDGEQVSMAFPNLYKEGWDFARAQIQVDWEMSDTETRIYSKGIRLNWVDGAIVYADFETRLNGPEHEDTLLLKIAVANTNANLTSRLTPFYSVGEGLWNWLDTALQSGKVRDGFYLGYGSIEDDAPDNSFNSAMYFELDNVAIAFDPAWPAIEQFNGRVEVHDTRLFLQGNGATLAGTPLQAISVIMPGIKGDGWLDVDAGLSPSASNLRWWLAESPVSTNTRAINSMLDFSGGFSGQVKLSLPLDDVKATPVYDVGLRLQRANVTHLPSGLKFEAMSGLLGIASASGLVARDLNLRFLDKPAKLTIATAESATRLTLDTRMSSADLVKLSGLGHDYGVSGEFPLRAQLIIRDTASSPVELQLDSSLRGVTSSLPKPFAKSAEDTLAFSSRTLFYSEGGSTDFRVGHLIHGATDWSHGQLQQARIFLGDANGVSGLRADPRDLLADKKVVVRAATERANLDEWTDYFDMLATREMQKASETPLVNEIDLRVDVQHFKAWGRDLNKTHMQVGLEPGDEPFWHLNIFADELQGSLAFATANRRMTIDLEHLTINSAAEEKPVSPVRALRPGDVAEMDIEIKRLVYNGRNHGHWSTRIRKESAGISMQDLQGKLYDTNGSASSQFQGHISWLEESSGQQTTLLTGQIEGKNLSDLTRLLGKPDQIQTESYAIESALVWAGDPFSAEMKKLSGTVAAKTGKGTVLESKDAAEAFKVFGLLNADSISRRLQLDFSDLYVKGVSFDQIEGKARLEYGTLFLESPLAIQGTTSGFKFTGSASLDTQTLDMEMVVVIPVTKNLPLAVTLLGAPQIGGALWVIDKLIGEPLSRLTSATYLIKGPFDDPNLKLKNVFDRSKLNLN